MGDPNRLKFANVNIILTAIGLPICSVGILMLFYNLVIINGREKFNGVIFGLIFFTIGLLLAFLRNRIVIDRQAGTVTRSWNLILTLDTSVHQLREFNWVVITREERRQKNSVYYVYPLNLVGSAVNIQLETLSDFPAARKQAEQVGKFLNFGVRDECGERIVVREAGTLDESLRKRLQRTGAASEPPEQLLNKRINTKTAGQEVTIDLPATGLTVMHYSNILICLAIPIISLAFLFNIFTGATRAAGNNPFALLVAGFFLLVIITPVFTAIGILISAFARDRLTVSHRKLSLERKYIIGSRNWQIPGDKLEELEIGISLSKRHSSIMPRSRVISARSDDATIEFGAGLSDQELQWLHSAISYVIAAPVGQKLMITR